MSKRTSQSPAQPEVVVNDDRYYLLNSCEFTVPKDYDHGTQLKDFNIFTVIRSQVDKFMAPVYMHESITDRNFAKATNKLVPDRTYRARFFGWRGPIGSEDHLAFLASQGAILVGTQGLTLVCQLEMEDFPIGKWVISFDKKEALWKSKGDFWLPCMLRHEKGDRAISLSKFERVWEGEDSCLLCVNE